MKCLYCNSLRIKRGKKNDIQRYSCKACGKTQQKHYKKIKIPEYKYEWVKNLSNEGNGISSISRLLHITKSSVQRVIMRISSKIEKTLYKEENQSYEIDELRTYCGNKNNECWIIYAINRTTGEIIDIIVGKRTKANIKQVVDTILKLNPKRIYTDGLNIYPALIPKSIHKIFRYCTNKIERHNLTLRTHIKAVYHSMLFPLQKLQLSN